MWSSTSGELHQRMARGGPTDSGNSAVCRSFAMPFDSALAATVYFGVSRRARGRGGRREDHSSLAPGFEEARSTGHALVGDVASILAGTDDPLVGQEEPCSRSDYSVHAALSEYSNRRRPARTRVSRLRG